MIYSKLLGAGVILAAAAMPNVAKAADASVPASDTWTGPYVGAFGGHTSLDIKVNMKRTPRLMMPKAKTSAMTAMSLNLASTFIFERLVL